MRKPFLLAALAVSVALVVLVGMDTSAQGPGQIPARQPVRPAYSGSPIALVDVSYIFEHHRRFKANMDLMKADVKRAETEVVEARKRMMGYVGQLKQLKPGSLEYKSLEKTIAEDQTAIALSVKQQRDDFLQHEAKIFHQTYQEVVYEVDYFAKSNGIALVLRFNGGKANMDIPESVLRHINKPVVWYAQDRDITKFVLDRLNGTSPNPAVSERPRPNVYIPR